MEDEGPDCQMKPSEQNRSTILEFLFSSNKNTNVFILK